MKRRANVPNQNYGIAKVGFDPCPFCGAAAKRFGGMFAKFDNGHEKLCGTHDGINHWMRSAQCLSKTGESGNHACIDKLVSVNYVALRRVLMAMCPFVGEVEDEHDPAIILARAVKAHDEQCGMEFTDTISVRVWPLSQVLADLQRRNLIGDDGPAKIVFDEFHAQA